MELSVEQLNALAKNPEVQALPASLAFPGKGAWWDTVNVATRLATEMDIWFVAQYAALALRTYPQVVESVSVEWERIADGGDVYVQSRLRINGEVYDPDGCDLPEEIDEQVAEIDDYTAMVALYRAVENAMGVKQVMDHDRRIDAAFPRPLRSVEEALAIANGVDQAVKSFVENCVLQADTAPATRPKGPGRI